MTNEDNPYEIGYHPGIRPSAPLVWPANRQKENQIQQIKGSAKPQATFASPSTQPSTSVVPPKTTPANVSHVRVISKPVVGGFKTITVQFTHPSNNPYFSGANVYLRRTGQAPVLVAGGAQSPITFTAPTHNAPHAIYVASKGNWGETDVLTSPSHPVSLK